MKTTSISIAATLALAVQAGAAVTVALGPVANPANGHRYYRLANGNWNSLRAFALGMGGDLATIDDAAENTWVRTNISMGTKSCIGLSDSVQEGTFGWADGSTGTYRNWRAGEPSNSATKDYVNFDGTPSGTWSVNDIVYATEGVAEFSGAVRVPQEFPDLPSAVAALPNAGTTEIILAPGTYTLNSYLTLGGVTLRGSGTGQTIINTTTDNIGLFLNGDVVIENLTLVNRTSLSTVVAFTGLSRLRNVRLTTQLGSGAGPLIDVGQQPGAVLSLENCEVDTSEYAINLIAGSVYAVNTIFHDLGSVTRSTNAATRFTAVNCIVTRCATTPLFATTGAQSMENSILHQNTATPGASIAFANCNMPNATGSNFSGDPRFVNTGANDFRLQSDSPCIDRGYIAAYMAALPQDFSDFAGNDRAIDDPTRVNYYSELRPIDVGAIEFIPAGPTPCPGDLNNDRMVDDADFVLFAAGYDALMCP